MWDFPEGYGLGLGGVRCIEVWGQTGTGVALGLSRRQPAEAQALSHRVLHGK